MKIYVPIKKSKENKTITRGFWRNSSGKIDYDYIKEYSSLSNLKIEKIEAIRKKYKQEAIFYLSNFSGGYKRKAYIWNGIKKITLKNQYISYCQSFYGLKNIIKYHIKNYGGASVTKYDKSYQIISYYN